MATWSQTDIDSLKAAVASGVLTVIFDGPPRREITYQSLRSMRDLLAEMIGQVAGNARTTYRLVATKKGV